MEGRSDIGIKIEKILAKSGPDKKQTVFSDSEKRENITLDLNQSILADAVINKRKDCTIDYKIGKTGNRETLHGIHTSEEMGKFIMEYRNNPVEAAYYMRENMFSIMKDPQMTPEQRSSRMNRYLDTYFSLIAKTDRIAFPADEKSVYRGIPDYMPDGLSDMGSDPRIDSSERRGREKIRVNKDEILARSKELFSNVFSVQVPEGTRRDEVDMFILKNVMHHVQSKVKYDYGEKFIHQYANQSIDLSRNIEYQLGVCRHQAMVAQVLLQTFGVESFLLKNDVYFDKGEKPEKHAANLVKIGNTWNLIDVTNPDIDFDKKRDYFIKSVPEKSFDFDNQTYVWDVKQKDGRQRIYKSRSDMYYRIVDNKSTPVR